MEYGAVLEQCTRTGGGLVAAYLGDGGANVAMDSYELQVRILLDHIQEPLQLAVTDPELTAGQTCAHICMHLQNTCNITASTPVPRLSMLIEASAAKN